MHIAKLITSCPILSQIEKQKVETRLPSAPILANPLLCVRPSSRSVKFCSVSNEVGCVPEALAKSILFCKVGFCVSATCALQMLTRPEKSLQFLLLILIFIYKVNLSPDMSLQYFFLGVIVLPDSFHLNRFFCIMNLVRRIVADTHVRSFAVVKFDGFIQISNSFLHRFYLLCI